MALIGTVMIRQINPDYIWSRFMGYCLIIAFSASFPLTMAMITSNTAGFTKETTVTAVASPFQLSNLKASFWHCILLGFHRILRRKHRRTADHVRSRSTQLFLWICGNARLLRLLCNFQYIATILLHLGEQEARQYSHSLGRSWGRRWPCSLGFPEPDG